LINKDEKNEWSFHDRYCRNCLQPECLTEEEIEKCKTWQVMRLEHDLKDIHQPYKRIRI